MTTFAELVNRCELAVNDEDNSTFTAEQIVKWINDGIRDYSQHFPRIKTQSISAVLNDNTYDLADDFMGVLSVEYPTGEDPPEYLSRLSYKHADFWTGVEKNSLTAVTCDGASHYIDNSHNLSAKIFCFTDACKCIRRFA